MTKDQILSYLNKYNALDSQWQEYIFSNCFMAVSKPLLLDLETVTYIATLLRDNEIRIDELKQEIDKLKQEVTLYKNNPNYFVFN